MSQPTGKKRSLRPDEQVKLREALQASTVASLMDSRRWEPGDLAFQGGTCLHLAYGSPRFSEDLDFMIRGGLSVDSMAHEVTRRLRLPTDMAADLSVSVTGVKADRNPRSFFVTLGGENVIGSVKVKIELWETPQLALDSLQLVVKTINTDSGLQAFVPSLTLEEIMADKVYAIGARPHLKPRDVFDLWWLRNHEPSVKLDSARLLSRLDIYPAKDGERETTACAWMDSGQKHLRNLESSAAALLVSTDLKRWLPSSWNMDPKEAAKMIEVSAGMLQQGMQYMRDYLDDRDADSSSPAPERPGRG